MLLNSHCVFSLFLLFIIFVLSALLLSQCPLDAMGHSALGLCYHYCENINSNGSTIIVP